MRIINLFDFAIIGVYTFHLTLGILFDFACKVCDTTIRQVSIICQTICIIFRPNAPPLKIPKVHETKFKIHKNIPSEQIYKKSTQCEEEQEKETGKKWRPGLYPKGHNHPTCYTCQEEEYPNKETNS